MNIRAKIFGGDEVIDRSPLIVTKRPIGATGAMLRSVFVARTETRTSNDRGGDRHRLGEPAVKIAHDGAEYPAALINLSGGGAMVEGNASPRLWDRVDLHLAGDGVIECAVRWLKGDRIGLEFAHETRIDCPADDRAALLRQVIATSFPEVAAGAPGVAVAEAEAESEGEGEGEGEFDPDQRGERRHPLIWSGSIYYNHDNTPVRLRNISTVGALIECATTLHVGGEPLLDLGEAGSVFATISWVVGDQAGLKFKEPFDLGGLARTRPEVAPAKWQRPSYLNPASSADSPWAKHWQRMSVGELKDELEGFIKR